MKSGTYLGEFKLHVVKYMHENHLSVREASAMFGIPSHETWKKGNRTVQVPNYGSKKQEKPKTLKSIWEQAGWI